MKAILFRWTSRFPVLAFLLLTFLITWGCVVYIAAGEAGLLGHKPSLLWLALVGQFGPLWAAVLLVGLHSGTMGLKGLVDRARAFRLDRGAWAVILLFAPATFLLTYAGFAVFHGGRLDFAKIIWPQLVGGLVVGTLIGLVFGGLSEEIGWRGYLLPRLQGRMHPLFAGTLVGLIWSFWHLDPEVVVVAFQKGWGPFGTEWARYQGRYLVETVPFSIFMAALFNRTRGSLFAMMLVHSIANAFVTGVWSNWKPIPTALRAWDAGVAVAMAIFFIWLWRRWEIQKGPLKPMG